MSPRRATAGDATAIALIHRRSAADPWSVSAVAELLADPHVFGFLADAGPGFVIARAVAGEAEILMLCVVPDARRGGHGTALIGMALDEAAAREAEAVFLEVAADNATALGLYCRLGFEAVGRRPGYYGKGAPARDARVLRLRLARPAGADRRPIGAGAD
jgi:ribosomal-protein-alanine N-acetyltransferase